MLKLLANLLWSGIRKYTENRQLPFLLFQYYYIFTMIFHYFTIINNNYIILILFSFLETERINDHYRSISTCIFQTKKVVCVFLLFQSSWQCIQNFINRNESNLQNEVIRNRSEAGLHWSIFAFYWYRIRLMKNCIFTVEKSVQTWIWLFTW